MGISLNWPSSTWWCHRSKQAPSHLSGQPAHFYHQQGETLVSLTSRTGAYHPWTESCLVASSKLLPDNLSCWRCFTKYLHGILSQLPVVLSVYHIIPLISLCQQISVESGWQSADCRYQGWVWQQLIFFDEFVCVCVWFVRLVSAPLLIPLSAPFLIWK